ncbi:MAG: glutathione S-transferase family protein [Chromatiales bacterium]|nr:glutathione S-transferase family protein [Chromatiales bacterium]
MAPIELYSFEGCPYAQRTRMALLEKQLDFVLHEIDLFNRPAWFRDVSPYGKVPVLRHEGVTIYESAIINQYLDERFPAPPLMPATPALRAQARIWMDYCETRFLVATHKLMSEANDTARRADNAGKLTEVLRFIEHEGLRKLGDGPYFLGETVSLVDLQFSPFFERFGTYERLGGATWPADCTRLRAWFEAMQGRESYRATSRPLEYHLEARRQMQLRIAEARRAAAAGPGAQAAARTH